MSPEQTLSVGRWVQYASVMMLWGSCLYLATLVPGPLARVVDARLRRFWHALAAAAILSTLSIVPLETAAIGQGWSDALDLAAIGAVFRETGLGRVWGVQDALALLMALALTAPSRSRAPLLAGFSALLLASFSMRGHAVMHGGWLGASHRFIDAVHVLCAGAWLGGLVVLVPVLSALAQPTLRAEATTALSRFSTAGHAVVALLLTSGAANTWLVLGRLPTRWTSHYQAVLALKLVAAAAMVALAVFNRYVQVPRLRRHQPGTLRAIRVAVWTEMALGLAAVSLVSVLGMLDPV
ncbi:MAG TPA: copper homeostasis membrane protein CopD [Burkholderiaceae bacterium]|nr:copper homeostasis membrane protein CopD [Burkholderiaceae bacterium]